MLAILSMEIRDGGDCQAVRRQSAWQIPVVSYLSTEPAVMVFWNRDIVNCVSDSQPDMSPVSGESAARRKSCG